MVVAAWSALAPARAMADQSLIGHPGQHVAYSFELEPELILVFDRPLDDGPGAGIRGSLPLLDRAFVPSINDSIALTFGFDKDPLFKGDVFYVPVGMQWNFWLSQNWSVMGEPGVLLQFADKLRPYAQIWGGARYHFTESVALTLRVTLPHAPAASLGLSLFL